jgi:hypothetical protein
LSRGNLSNAKGWGAASFPGREMLTNGNDGLPGWPGISILAKISG